MKKTKKENKINKIIDIIYDEIKSNIFYYLFLLFILLINVIKLDYYIFSPGSLMPLDDRIKVENAYPQSGSFNLTYVTARNGTVLNVLISYIIPTWDRVSLDKIRVEGETDKEANKRGHIELEQTSYDAIIAAFKEAGLEYKVKSLDLIVTYIYEEAKTTLKVGDIIKKINNVEVNNIEDIHNEIWKYKEGEELKISVIRNNHEKEATAVLQKQNDNTLIGIYINALKEVETNPKVEYVFKNSESGSSRGLLCALEIYNRITEEDITKGRKIAGTGVIYEDGSIGEIDGVKYKLAGAVNKKADIFICPEENYEEAIKLKEKMKYKIKIISAKTLKEVIEELKK